MINKLEAINIGKAIVAGAKKEIQGRTESMVMYHVNGSLIYALDNLWLDVFSNKVKSYFDHDKEKFYLEIWDLA